MINGFDKIIRVSIKTTLPIMMVSAQRIILNQSEVDFLIKSRSGIVVESARKKITSVQKPVNEYPVNNGMGR